jgi:uncharacterized protein (DUF58 family)
VTPRWGRAKRSIAATQAGWCFAGMTLVTGGLAFATGNNLLYLLLGSMAGFLILSGLLSEAALRGLDIERVLPAELYAKAPARVLLRITKQQGKLPSLALRVEDRVQTESGTSAVGECRVARLGRGESISQAYDFEAARRGDLTFLGVSVATRFPFGLFEKRALLERPQHAIVFPEVRPIDRVQESGAAPESASGAFDRPLVGDVVGGLRTFQQGDAPRQIHWRHTLRSGQLLVAERDRANAPDVEVTLQVPSRASEAMVEERVTRAASRVHAYHRRGWSVGLRADDLFIRSATGQSHRNELLAVLARYRLPGSAGVRTAPSGRSAVGPAER